MYLDSAKLEDKSTTQDGVTTYELKYTWEVNVKYGIHYTITEKNYNVDIAYKLKIVETDGEKQYRIDADLKGNVCIFFPAVKENRHIFTLYEEIF